MKKLIFIPIIGLCCYFYSAVYSLNQIHKGIFYNDKTLIREYIEWKELRHNFKNYMNIQIFKQTQKNKDLKNLESLSILVSSFASKIINSFLDTYLNPDGLSILLENYYKTNALPEPNFKSLIGGFKIMKFTGHSSFKIEEKFKNQKLTLIFKRIGINWKIVRIELPNNLFDKLSKNLI